SIFQSANYISSFIFYELIYLELGIIRGYNLDVYQILCFPQNISVYLKQKSEFRWNPPSLKLDYVTNPVLFHLLTSKLTTCCINICSFFDTSATFNTIFFEYCFKSYNCFRCTTLILYMLIYWIIWYQINMCQLA